MSATREKQGNRGCPIRVLVADDHEVVRNGVASALESVPDIELVGLAADGKQGIEMAKELVPDVIIMDVNMPHIDGIEATRIISSTSPQIQIIGFSLDGNKAIEDAMLKAGATDHILKDTNISELWAAVRNAHKKGKAKNRTNPGSPEQPTYLGI